MKVKIPQKVKFMMMMTRNFRQSVRIVDLEDEVRHLKLELDLRQKKINLLSEVNNIAGEQLRTQKQLLEQFKECVVCDIMSNIQTRKG